MSKTVLVRAMARNNGSLFKLYASWYSEAPLAPACLHHKFLGVLLNEVLMSGTNETLLYTILPVLSKALKSEETELQNAGLLAIGQLCCKSTLSKEYCGAFMRQILLTLRTSSDIEPGV